MQLIYLAWSQFCETKKQTNKQTNKKKEFTQVYPLGPTPYKYILDWSPYIFLKN